MPRLDEDFIGSVLPEADVAKFYAEFEAELEVHWNCGNGMAVWT